MRVRGAIGAAIAAVALGLVPALASASAPTKLVRYHGVVLRVPAAWPVYQLSADPSRCVRFDRHAVYLGTPAASQSCPPHAAGRTEAILVSPLSVVRSARAEVVSRAALPAAAIGPVTSSAATIPALGVRVTVTWGAAPGVIRAALAGDRALRGRLAVGRPVLSRRSPGVARAAAGPSRSPSGASRAPSASAARRTSPTSTPFTGLGVDACSAPSSTQMADWGTSPYHAIGIYLGGANMACSQGNLSSAWTSAEVSAGWHLIPTYVGLQAPGNSCGCAAIRNGQAASEGAAAAQDAMAQAQLLGIGPGNPIYDDMEAYTRGGHTTTMVLNFLQAWTQTLHASGYLSGVYSSALSGMADLSAQYGTSYVEPDDLWIANWNGLQSTSDGVVPAADWAQHQRVHQYQGGHNETYNGATLSVDSDYLDGATAGAAQPFPDGSFVEPTGSNQVFEIAGGAPLYVSDPSTVPNGATPVTQITQAQYDALGAVPLDGTFLTTTAGAIYRVAGGAAMPVSNWAIYGGQQSSLTIDPWDVANAGNPLSHLNASPANGTTVEGLPSGHYWTFVAGNIQPASATPAAIQVDDESLATFHVLAPPPPPPPPLCVVPAMHKLTYHQAIAALRRSHCRLGKVRWPRRRHHRPIFRVQSQHYRPHTKLRNGTRINITVYYA